MFSATRPNSPKANSENAIVVTLSALSSGARRNAVERGAEARASVCLHCERRHVRRVEHDLAVIQLDAAELGAADELRGRASP